MSRDHQWLDLNNLQMTEIIGQLGLDEQNFDLGQSRGTRECDGRIRLTLFNQELKATDEYILNPDTKRLTFQRICYLEDKCWDYSSSAYAWYEEGPLPRQVCEDRQEDLCADLPTETQIVSPILLSGIMTIVGE